jgi:hypothetical protein
MKYSIAICALLGYTTKAALMKMDLADMTNETEDVLMQYDVDAPEDVSLVQ